MKYITSIILFFLISLMFSQTKIENLTNITLSKIYDEPDDGSCNSFITGESAKIISKRINDCDKLVLDLINLKSNLKSRKSLNLCCRDGAIGCPSIVYMVEYQFNKFIDTIYFNSFKNENFIIDWKLKKKYEDNNTDLVKLLKQKDVFKKLIEINLDKIYREIIIYNKPDSLNIQDLKIYNKNFYGLNRIQIDSLIGGFGSLIEIERDIMNKEEKFKYYGNNQDSYNEYYFVNDLPINEIITNKIYINGNYFPNDKVFNINGIILYDDEKYLKSKFPSSTKYIENQKEYFKNENGDYIITVKINDRKGAIDFILNDSKIKKIIVDFYYPKP